MDVLGTKDTEKAELLNAIFASVFTFKASLRESQTLKTRENVWRKEDFPFVPRLSKPNTHKSMGPNGMHPRVLREMAVITKQLSIIMENKGGVSGLEESQCHSSLPKGQGLRKLQPFQLHLHPWKADGASHPGGHL